MTANEPFAQCEIGHDGTSQWSSAPAHSSPQLPRESWHGQLAPDEHSAAVPAPRSCATCSRKPSTRKAGRSRRHLRKHVTDSEQAFCTSRQRKVEGGCLV